MNIKYFSFMLSEQKITIYCIGSFIYFSRNNTTYVDTIKFGHSIIKSILKDDTLKTDISSGNDRLLIVHTEDLKFYTWNFINERGNFINITLNYKQHFIFKKMIEFVLKNEL